MGVLGTTQASEANQYTLVKAMIDAATRENKHEVAQSTLAYPTIRRLRKEGYRIEKQGHGATSFVVILW